MELDDGMLLARFISGGDAGAFEELVRRHGPLVLGVCRRVLRHEEDAEDAFQAVFVVLARKASSIDPSKPLANWLYGVALRVSLDLRASRRSREERERKAVRRSASPPESDVRSLVDEEVQRLPERYRSPFILCTLEGKTGDDAARALGCPRGTVATRLVRARRLLKQRLEERGVVVTGTTLALLLASLEVPAALASATTGTAANGSSVAILASGGIKAMTTAKLKIAAVWMTVALTATSLGAVGLAEQQTRTAAAPNEAKARFEQLAGLLRPLPGEYDWRDAVPWHVRIQEARRKAVKEDKPLLIFSCANACVLGRT